MLNFLLATSTLFGFVNVNPPQLEGVWETPFKTEPLGFSNMRVTTFTGDQMKQDIRIFLDNPTFGRRAESIAFTGNFALGNVVDEAQQIFAIDMSFIKLERTALIAETVVKNNQEAVCGFTDWELGVTKDVTGRVCEDNQPTPVGKMTYGVVQQIDNTLRFCKQWSETPQGRTSQLHPRDIFYRHGEL